MATLRITAKKLNIELDKGATFKPIFYVLDENNDPIDLTGYKAVMQIKVDYSDVVPLFDLTTENSGITIISGATVTIKAGTFFNGEELLVDLVITNVWGIQPYITDTDTSTITQDDLVYQVDLIDTTNDVIKYLKGCIKLNTDGTT